MQTIPRPFASLQQRYSNKIKLHIDTRQLHFSPEFLWGKLADLLVCAFFLFHFILGFGFSFVLIAHGERVGSQQAPSLSLEMSQQDGTGTCL